MRKMEIEEIMKSEYPEMGDSTCFALSYYGHVTIFDMAQDINKILKTDCYNTSHQFLKENTDWEVSHIYVRGQSEVFVFMLSHILVEALREPITQDWIEQAERICWNGHIPFPRNLFERVVNEFNGYVPLRVQALPDGTIIPKGTPFAQIRNTEEGFGEIATWWEGVFLRAHYPFGVMSTVYQYYKYLRESFELERVNNPDLSWNFYKYRFHSFAFRSFNSDTDAIIAGTAWGMLMHGTDDLHILQLMRFAELGSISATAHKTMQQFDDELAGFKRAIDAQADLADNNSQLGRIVALVIDTYNPERVIRDYLIPLSQYANTKNMHIVMRPDSGNVIEQAIAIYQVVKSYGLTNVSVIIGEGMSLKQILIYDKMLTNAEVPLSFVFYGIGGGIHKDINRDTTSMAMKTAYSNGENRCKFSVDPIKASIAGAVNIYMNQDADLVVDHEENVEQGLYEDIYYYDKRMADNHEYPVFRVFSLKETYDNIHNEVVFAEHYGCQENIIKSESILNEVNRIAEKHGLITVSDSNNEGV